MPEILLTVDEAAKRLKMNPATLRRQLRAGRIASVRTGKLWRIPESALEPQRALEQQNVLTKTPLPPAEMEALFAPPTPAEIARRLRALDDLVKNTPRRAAPALDLSPEADPYGYEERADQIMGVRR